MMMRRKKTLYILISIIIILLLILLRVFINYTKLTIFYYVLGFYLMPVIFSSLFLLLFLIIKNKKVNIIVFIMNCIIQILYLIVVGFVKNIVTYTFVLLFIVLIVLFINMILLLDYNEIKKNEQLSEYIINIYKYFILFSLFAYMIGLNNEIKSTLFEIIIYIIISILLLLIPLLVDKKDKYIRYTMLEFIISLFLIITFWVLLIISMINSTVNIDVSIVILFIFANVSLFINIGCNWLNYRSFKNNKNNKLLILSNYLYLIPILYIIFNCYGFYRLFLALH